MTSDNIFSNLIRQCTINAIEQGESKQVVYKKEHLKTK